MGRKRKQPEYPEIKLKNENLLKLVSQSDKSLWTIAKENNTTVEEIERLLNEYHDSLDLKLEQDKQKRKDLRELFNQIETGLKELRESRELDESNNPPELPQKEDYVEINVGGKWVKDFDRKRGEGVSYIVNLTDLKKKEDLKE